MLSTVAMLLSGCDLPFSQLDGATPEDAVRNIFSDRALQFHGLREGIDPLGDVVLVSYQIPTNGGAKTFAYRRVAQRLTGRWHITGVGGFIEGTGRKEGEPLDFQSQEVGELPSGIVVVLGRTLDPGIVLVEVTFDTGQVVRDGITDGMFFVAAKDVRTACHLRALDAHGQEVFATDPSAPPHNPVEFSSIDVPRCG